MPEVTISAPIKSAWSSKINWVQAVSLVASLLTFFGLNLDEETKAALVAAINGIAVVVTWFLRTFKTTAITKSSVGVSS